MTDDRLPSLEDLAKKYYAADDLTRKSPTYLRSYERILEHRRQDRLSILELGIASGASLLSWHDYLPNATIVGIDIDEAPARVRNLDRVHIIQGSQDDPRVLDRAGALVGGGFDLIVDDASHIGYLTKRSLTYLFPRLLVPGGWYAIEDFGTGYLPDYADGQRWTGPIWSDAVPGNALFRSSQYGMVGVVKQLVDHLMQELTVGTRPYLAIERLVIETNIAFIEKSLKPGASAPEEGAIHPADIRPAELAELATLVKLQGKRLADLERVLDRVRRFLAPALWLRRKFGVRGGDRSRSDL